MTEGVAHIEIDAESRLDLVRTLRELGLGLELVQAVLSRTRTVADVAAAHRTGAARGWIGAVTGGAATRHDFPVVEQGHRHCAGLRVVGGATHRARNPLHARAGAGRARRNRHWCTNHLKQLILRRAPTMPERQMDGSSLRVGSPTSASVWTCQPVYCKG